MMAGIIDVHVLPDSQHYDKSKPEGIKQFIYCVIDYCQWS